MFVESWLKEQRQARTADLVVNNTLKQLKERSRILDFAAPLKTKEGRDWLAYITQAIEPIASLVATGAEYPATKKGKFNQIQAKLFKAALRYEWTEDVQWKLSEVKEFADLRGITVQNISVGYGKIQLGQDNSLAELIFGTVSALVRGHINLLDYLTWQVLQTGKINYVDTRTGLSIDNLDWTQALDAPHNHFPLPVYTNSAGRAWDQLDTANGLQDLVDMHYIYRYDNGFPADKICMSEQLLLALLRQKSTKEAVVQSMTVGYQITGTPSIDQLNEVMTRRFLPQIEIVEDQFELDFDTNGSTTPTRFLDPTFVVFVKKGMAERCLGATLENKGKAGIYSRTYQKSENPPLDITVTASMLLPCAPAISKLGFARKMSNITDLNATMNLTEFNW